MISNFRMRGRELLAKQLSPQVKSKLRSALYSMGLISLRGAETIIFESIRRDQSRSFIQIGVNDGQYADPINLAIRQFGLKGALVEPQPLYLKAAQKTYSGVGGLEFFNYAISDTEGVLSFFIVDTSQVKLPTWVQGVGSLHRDKLLNLKNHIPDIDRYIQEIKVVCISVESLLERTSIKNPDLLIIDAEGHDAAILKQFDFKAIRPNLVVFEAESMTSDDASDCRKHLESNGYLVREIGQDSVALKLDTNLCRKYA